MLVDSHCHLDYFSDEERLDVIQRARGVGVVLMQTISTKVSEFGKIIEIVEDKPFMYASVGTHPENAHDDFVSSETLIDLCQKYPKKIIGIGETGLDYYRSTETSEIQKRCFIEHIIASQETGKPLIVHARSADDDILKILSQEKAKKDFPILMHCFTGGPDFAKKLIELGCSISYSGIITFKNAALINESMQITPIDKLLIETDAPFLAPSPMRGKRNEPSFLMHTAKFIAEKRNIDFEDFCLTVYNNFIKLFNISP